MTKAGERERPRELAALLKATQRAGAIAEYSDLIWIYCRENRHSLDSMDAGRYIGGLLSQMVSKFEATVVQTQETLENVRAQVREARAESARLMELLLDHGYRPKRRRGRSRIPKS